MIELSEEQIKLVAGGGDSWDDIVGCDCHADNPYLD